MSDTSNLGSSPPEIGPPPPQAHWEGVEVKGSGPFATWTQIGLIPWQVEWQEALEYAEAHYRHVSGFTNGPTNNGTCLAAALVTLYQEDEGNGVWSDVKSIVFMSSIPRGIDSTTVHGRLSDPRRCHPTWKGYSYYWVEEPPKKKGGKTTMATMEGPTRLHAEDVAIDMMLRFQDQLEAAGNAAARDPPPPGRDAPGRKAPAQDAPRPPRVHWLGDMSMLVYGVQATKVPGPPKGRRPTWIWTVKPEGQVWPCGPPATDPHNRKEPSCQEVLDRMGIKWRFGIIPPKEPTPEPELPPIPPGYSGGGGGSGSGGGGGYHPGYASGPNQPTSEYGSNVFTSDFFEASSAYVRNVMACRADAAKRGHTPVHPSRSRRQSREAILRSRRNTHRLNTVLQMLQKPAPLSDSLAKLSLAGRPAPVQQPSVHAVRVQPAQSQHITVGARVMRPAVHVSSTATGTPGKAKKPPSAGPQVAAAQTRPRTVAPTAQQETARRGVNGGSLKPVLADGTRRQ
jgi:hypothetical protein